MAVPPGAVDRPTVVAILLVIAPAVGVSLVRMSVVEMMAMKMAPSAKVRLTMSRIVRLCFLVWMLATACGCERSAFAFWGCSYMNLGGETFSDVVISYGHHRWELGDDFRGGGAETYMGVVGRMPRAVDIGVTSKDGRRHHIYVVVPRRPAWYRHRTSRIYLVTESRCRAIATWDDLGDMYYRHHPSKLRPRSNWSCAVADEAKEPFSRVMVTVGGTSYPLGAVGPKSDASSSALGPIPKVLNVSFASPDGKRHKVRIAVPPAPAGPGGLSPELYLIIANTGKVMATYTCPAELVGVVWSYGIGTHLNERFTNVVVAYEGSVNAPWRLDAIAPGGANAAPAVIGPMPKAVDVSFTSPDGKRHKVHVILPPLTAAQGEWVAEVELEIEKGGKVDPTAMVGGCMGAHADIGGGYGNDPISEETLSWMTGQAGAAGMVFTSTFPPAAFTASNIHDSYMINMGGYPTFAPEQRTNLPGNLPVDTNTGLVNYSSKPTSYWDTDFAYDLQTWSQEPWQYYWLYTDAHN